MNPETNPNPERLGPGPNPERGPQPGRAVPDPRTRTLTPVTPNPENPRNDPENCRKGVTEGLGEEIEGLGGPVFGVNGGSEKGRRVEP